MKTLNPPEFQADTQSESGRMFILISRSDRTATSVKLHVYRDVRLEMWCVFIWYVINIVTVFSSRLVETAVVVMHY